MDIRKGTLTSHTRLHTEEKGMTSFLAGKATTDEIIKHNEICENLDFIPAGPIAPNPSELLLSEQLEVMIAELRNHHNTTILLIEHDMKLVMGISDRIYVVNQGTPLANGTPEQIRNNPDVIRAYLGEA